MKITAETELMKNQKHADTMAPDIAFEVLQNSDGDALFFSIGTDHVFYVTREVRASQTGWTMIDLSSALSTSHSGAVVAAKSFSVSQNAQTMAFDVALVVTVGGVDFLYLSLNHSNNADAWANGLSWIAVPFDAASVTAPKPLTIADVYLMNMPSNDGTPPVQNCFVDILREPGNPLQLLDRYYIQPGSTPQWARHTLAADLKQGSISSCLGHRTNDFVPGIYTFGTIETTQELIYSPQYNYFRPAAAPEAARLTLPAGATSIASALNNTGDTNLFIAASGGLYLFAPDNQGDQANPTLVVPSSTVNNQNIFAGTSSLAASTVGSRTVVWGLNAQGDLFYVYCPAGKEGTTSAWSTPVPNSSGVEGFAFYLNLNASNNVLFAHISGQQLIQLTQDPVTSAWTPRSIVLPPTSINDMIEYDSFTSHICISDDNGIPAPNTPVTLTSTSPVTVYVNDVYHVLTPTVPLNTASDAVGTVTIIQETQTLSAVSYQITITGPPSVVANIDPLSKGMETLSTIRSGDDLGKVQVQSADGTQKSLVPDSVPSDAKNAAAQSIVQLLKVKATLPADGSTKTANSASATAVSHLVSASPNMQPMNTWGMSLSGNSISFHEGDAAHQLLPGVHEALSVKAVGRDFIGSIKVAAGDLFNWLKSAWDAVESFVVQEAEGFYHFVCTIAGKVYTAILDCVSAVVGAVEFVFNQIKVFFEDLIAWLGFLFAWKDIVRTHKVVKNILKQYSGRIISELDTLETSINNAFISLEDKVNTWAGVTDPGILIGTQEKSGSSVPGTTSPQSNWALHHTKNGVPSANTPYNEPETGSSALSQVLTDLEALMTQEGDYLQTTITQIKEQVIDNFASLTPIQVIEKVMAIGADLILKSTRNLVVKIVDIIKIIANGLLDALDAPLNIPILSSIYKTISGDDLSFMDLICLIGAIPITVIFKLITNETPFPDDSFTQSLIDAPDFASLSKLLSPPTTEPLAQKVALPKSSAGIHPEAVVHIAAGLSPLDKANASLNFVSLFGSILVVVFAALKKPASNSAAPGPAPAPAPAPGPGPGPGPAPGPAAPVPEPQPPAPIFHPDPEDPEPPTFHPDPEEPEPAPPTQPPTISTEPPTPHAKEDLAKSRPSRVPSHFGVERFTILQNVTAPNKVLRIGAATSYLLFVASDYATAWSNPKSLPTGFNDAITLLSIGKTCLDNNKTLASNKTWNEEWSPGLESAINLVWFFPPIFAYEAITNPGPKTSDKLSLASNMAFDSGGLLTFLTSPKIGNAESQLAFFGICQVLALSYGALCAATGAELLNGN